MQRISGIAMHRMGILVLCFGLLLLVGCTPRGIWSGGSFSFFSLGPGNDGAGIYGVRVYNSSGGYSAHFEIGQDYSGNWVFKPLARFGLLGFGVFRSFSYNGVCSSYSPSGLCSFRGRLKGGGEDWSASGSYNYSGQDRDFSVTWEDTEILLGDWLTGNDNDEEEETEKLQVPYSPLAPLIFEENLLIIPENVLKELRSRKDITFTALNNGNQLVTIQFH